MEVRLQQSVWLFTRDAETVRMAVHPSPDGFQLTIAGPGAASARVDFAHMDNLNRFRDTYIEDLLARGFHLDAVSERRIPSRDTSAAIPVERRRPGAPSR